MCFSVHPIVNSRVHPVVRPIVPSCLRFSWRRRPRHPSQTYRSDQCRHPGHLSVFAAADRSYFSDLQLVTGTDLSLLLRSPAGHCDGPVAASANSNWSPMWISCYSRRSPAGRRCGSAATLVIPHWSWIGIATTPAIPNWSRWRSNVM